MRKRPNPKSQQATPTPAPQPKEPPAAKAQPLTNAEKQARFKQRKAENGFIRRTVWINLADLHDGNQAKHQGLPPILHAKHDQLSWLLGYTLPGRLVAANVKTFMEQHPDD